MQKNVLCFIKQSSRKVSKKYYKSRQSQRDKDHNKQKGFNFRTNIE